MKEVILKKNLLNLHNIVNDYFKNIFTWAGSCQVEVSADLFVFLVSRLYSACLHF